MVPDPLRIDIRRHYVMAGEGEDRRGNPARARDDLSQPVRWRIDTLRRLLKDGRQCVGLA